jgi:hypothetical protein
MQNEKKEAIRKQLKDLLEHLKEKNTDGTLTEACGRLSGTISAFDDDSNPPGTPPPPPGTPPPVGP